MQQRLETLKKQAATLEEAIAMLDRGEPIDAVRAKARSGNPFGGDGPGERMRLREGRREDGGDRGRPDGAGGPNGPGPGPAGDMRPDGAGPGGPLGLGPRGPGGQGPDGRRPGGDNGGLVGDGPQGRNRDADLPRLEPGEMPDPPLMGRMLKFLHEHRPEMADRIEKLRAEHPDEFRQFVSQRAAQIVGMMRDQAEDPELWQLRERVFDADRATHKAAKAYHTAKAEERDAALKSLREAATVQFEARAEVSRAEIRKAKAWADRLESELDERLSSREQFIDERMKELMAAPPPGGPKGPDGGPGDQRPRGKGMKGKDLFDGDKPGAGNPPPPGKPGTDGKKPD